MISDYEDESGHHIVFTDAPVVDEWEEEDEPGIDDQFYVTGQ